MLPEQPLVSVVVPAFNEEERLPECLSRIRKAFEVFPDLAYEPIVKFVILHKHPFSTSGRKGTAYGIGSWLKFALQRTLFHRKAVRDKAFAEKWYEVDR